MDCRAKWRSVLVWVVLLGLCTWVGPAAGESCAGKDGKTKLDVAKEINTSNMDRRQTARVATAFIYLFITIGYICLALWLAVLMGWIWQPSFVVKFISKEGTPTPKQVTIKSTIFWVVVIAIIVLLMALGGLPGWMVLGFAFLVACVCIVIVALLVRRDGKRVAPTDLPQDAEDPVEQKKASSLRWSGHPLALGHRQVLLSLVMIGLMLLCLCLTLVVFFAWSPGDYKVYGIQTGCEVVEFIPANTARAIGLLYSWERFASNLRAGIYAKIATSYCGGKFTGELTTLEEKEKLIFKPFVDLYKINMTWYEPSDWREYKSVNEWFVRHINNNYRTFTDISSTSTFRQIVSPADCRMLVFPTLEDSRVWVKGDSFNYHELLDVGQNDALAKKFEGGTMVVARLAPQDYHRFNTPINRATVKSITTVGGSYWSVNPDAAVSGNYAFYNLRQVILLEAEGIGEIAYVAIGATCVGSVILTVKVGDVVNLGQEIGYMQFGGSTVIMLFQKGAADFDSDLKEFSLLPTESYIQVNYPIGNFKTPIP